jgi:hypothetical protein
MPEKAVTKLGRVVEEYLISYRTIGQVVLFVFAAGFAWEGRNIGGLQLQ